MQLFYANLELGNFIDKSKISKIENFEYSGVYGSVDIIGYNIFTFRREKAINISALSIDDINNNCLLFDVSNSILDFIGASFQLGDDFKKIIKLFTKHNFIDDLLEDKKRYYYLENKALTVLGFSTTKKLISIELISDSDIINNRLSIF